MTAKTTRVEPPQEVEALCPGCRERGPHRVEKGHVAKRGGAVEGTFTCRACGHTHQGLIEIPRPVDVPFLVSDDEGQTEPFSVQVLDDEAVRVGDEFEVEEALVEVTAIELGDGRRVQRARASDVQTLWGKDITQINVGFAMNIGDSTRSFETPFDPDDTIGIGDTFDLDGMDVEVKQVITDAGRRRHGRHNVREIRRVWLKKPQRRRRESPGGKAHDAGRSSRSRAGGRTPSNRSSKPSRAGSRARSDRSSPSGRRGPPSGRR